MKKFDPSEVRSLFPVLNQKINGSAPVFFDGPGGTQAPEAVIDAMGSYMRLGIGNLLKSKFFSVENTHNVVGNARVRGAKFLNAPDLSQIVFGANTSTISAHISRSISREWQEGDEVIVTDLDHYSNVSFWKQAAEDRGVKVHVVPVHAEDCTLDYDFLEKVLSKKTKLVAFTLAANVCGSLTDAKRIVRAAKAVGAMTYVDAVHYSPHFLPDVQDLDCDFLVCSPYKFYGPHLGMLYGKMDHLKRLQPYKVEPASNEPPERWETGTKSFEALAGFVACVDYLASLGEGSTLRDKLISSYKRVAIYEQEWSRKFLERAKGYNNISVHGITDLSRLGERTATFALTFKGRTPQEVSDLLAAKNITSGASSFYGIGITKALGLDSILRVGCVHYNTMEEMDRLFAVFDQLP